MNGLPEVMFFLPHLGGGGAEMNAIRVASELRQFGCQPSFAVARGGGVFERFVDAGTPVVQLDTGTINSSTLRLSRALRPLRRLIAQRRPAIVCPIMDSPAMTALRAVQGMPGRP